MSQDNERSQCVVCSKLWKVLHLTWTCMSLNLSWTSCSSQSFWFLLNSLLPATTSQSSRRIYTSARRCRWTNRPSPSNDASWSSPTRRAWGRARQISRTSSSWLWGGSFNYQELIRYLENPSDRFYLIWLLVVELVDFFIKFCLRLRLRYMKFFTNPDEKWQFLVPFSGPYSDLYTRTSKKFPKAILLL